MIERLRALTADLLERKFVRDTLILQVGKVGVTLIGGLASLLIWRLMTPAAYGIFGLAQSFFNLWHALDLTGVGVSTNTRLAMAAGARDHTEVLNLMGFYVKVSLLVNITLAALIAVVGLPLAALLHADSPQVAALALWLALAGIADGQYNLITIALQSRRSMRHLALLQNANQFVLSVSAVLFVAANPSAESLVTARIVYSVLTLAIAFWAYGRLRAEGDMPYPPLTEVYRHALRVSARPYWQFGVANAVDRNIASLFTQIPIQLVGSLAGSTAAGYLTMSLSALAQASLFTSAVFDNMQAVVPQAVGRGDFTGLWRNFRRVLLALAGGGAIFYGAQALLSPLLIPLLLGEHWRPAVPALVVLALYGLITTVGGIFGPLYRALNLMRGAIAAKLIALVLILPAGSLLLANAAGGLSPSDGAAGGAWIISALFAVSVTLTAVITLRQVRRRAQG